MERSQLPTWGDALGGHEARLAAPESVSVLRWATSRSSRSFSAGELDRFSVDQSLHQASARQHAAIGPSTTGT